VVIFAFSTSNLTCTLTHTTLSNNEESEALSYTWGVTEPKDPSYLIVRNMKLSRTSRSPHDVYAILNMLGLSGFMRSVPTRETPKKRPSKYR
jgi:hypothetical protein